MRIKNYFQITILLIIMSLLIVTSNTSFDDPAESVRAFTRNIEFDYVSWIFDALGQKITGSTLSLPQYLPEKTQHDIVLEYLNLVDETKAISDRILQAYADPGIADPKSATDVDRQLLEQKKNRMKLIQPVAENILEEQISSVLAEMGLTFIGQPMPPVLYHITPLPYALIVSPRNIIRQDADISLETDLSIEQIVDLEDRVSKGMNVSALVEEVGGIGVYPTMIEQTSALDWLSETISHEWIHNFLTLRPLGLNYETTPELRTMNETTASIAGTEIGLEVLLKYYPEKVPPPPAAETNQGQTQEQAPQPSGFDFRAEMHTTRVETDLLLAEGKIDEAEQYMEQRRAVFLKNGYLIRKLNQAYFAFHGAYANEPGGAAGEDPVGPQVRALRSKSASLADFINRISWMTSFDQLKQAAR